MVCTNDRDCTARLLQRNGLMDEAEKQNAIRICDNESENFGKREGANQCIRQANTDMTI